MIDKILPFLNKFVPIGLAVKGLEKINPKIKTFLGGAAAAGYSTEQAMEFLREQFSGPQMNEPGEGARPDEKAAFNRRRQEEAPERIAQGAAALGAGALGGLAGLGQAATQIATTDQPTQSSQSQNPSAPGPSTTQSKNQSQAPLASQQPGGFQEFIKQNPELGAYLDSLMQKGMNPIQAAGEAKKNKKFGTLVQSIEGQMGQSFEDLIAQLFQGSQGAQGQQSQQGQSQSQPQGNATPAMTQFMTALQEYKKLRQGK